MSGIGLSELVLLFVIGLLILGPDKLPRVASQLGRWVGRARRTANQLRYQLERELSLAEQEKSKKPERKPGPRPDTSPETPKVSEPDPEAAGTGGHNPEPDSHESSAPGGHEVSDDVSEARAPKADAAAAEPNDRIRQA